MLTRTAQEGEAILKVYLKIVLSITDPHKPHHTSESGCFVLCLYTSLNFLSCHKSFSTLTFIYHLNCMDNILL